MNIEDINKIIRNTITNGEKTYHKWYKRTVEKAEEYRMMVTGEGMDKALKRFIKREDEDAFKQRTDITQHITSAILKTITDVQKKVPRSNTIKRIINNKNETSLNTLKKAMANFGNGSYDKYVDNMFLNLNNIDPNAFVSIEWDEQMNVYPFEIYSYEVLNYKKKNNKLEWLLAKNTFILNGKER